jgi:hypothetical protein
MNMLTILIHVYDRDSHLKISHIQIDILGQNNIPE